MEPIQTYKTYSEIINHIRPLDLLAFRGSDFVSNFISTVQDKVLGSGEFTHVGLVVTKELLPSVPQLKPGLYYVWESTMSSEYPGSGLMSPDVVTGKGKFGVQIRCFKDVVKTYTSAKGSTVAVCRLKNNPWASQSYNRIYETNIHLYDRRENIINQMEQIHEDYGDRSYELSCCQLLASLFSCLRPFRDNFQQITVKDQKVIINYRADDENDNEWFFCSELVGLIYKKIGVLPSSIDARNITPMDLLGYDQDHEIDIVEDPIHIISDKPV